MPKLSSPSFKVVIKSKPLSDGTYPVRLQSNWHGQSEVSLGISLSSPSDFDKVRQRVRKSVRNSAVFNRIIEQKLLIVNQDYMTKLSSGVTVFTHRGLLDCIRSTGVDTSDNGSLVSSCFTYVMKKKIVGTAGYYKVSMNHVIRCYGDVSLTEITDGDKFLEYLDGRGICDSTRRTILTLFAAVWQNAVSRGAVPSSCKFPIAPEVYNRLRRNVRPYHLDEFQLEVLYEHYMRSVLTTECFIDIDLRRTMSIKNGSNGIISGHVEFSKPFNEIIRRGSMDWAMAIYGCMLFCGGASPIDMGKMKVGEGFVEFVKDGKRAWKVSGMRSKTGRQFCRTIRISPLTEAFFRPFIETADERQGYLFNILRISHDDDRDITDRGIERRRMRSFSNLVNPLLVKLWGELNAIISEENKRNNRSRNLIDVNCRMYSARHSFGTVSLSKSGNINALCSQMGRSPSGIATYVHMLMEDELLMEESEKLGF